MNSISKSNFISVLTDCKYDEKFFKLFCFHHSLQLVNTHTPGKKVWLGGLGPAWTGGINNLSDTYAAGFL